MQSLNSSSAGRRSALAGLEPALIELGKRPSTREDVGDVDGSSAYRVLLAPSAPAWLGMFSTPTGMYPAIRRLADVVVATVGLVAFVPVLLIAAVAIWVDSPGPALYWQDRVGRYGRPFRLAKLRTMIRDAEPDGRAVWAQERDPRVTRVGALLRRCHLDEMPQLWNVLRGEMSLIGPRPERPEFVELLASAIPFYGTRHAIRPGITGWAQVRFKYVSTIEESATKLQYDLFYLRHRSYLLDAIILVKTFFVVLQFRKDL